MRDGDEHNPYQPPESTSADLSVNAIPVPPQKFRNGYLWAYLWYPIVFVAIPAQSSRNVFNHAVLMALTIAVLSSLIYAAAHRRSVWIAISTLPGLFFLIVLMQSIARNW